jgi:RimJ/RimL family protein N-acetyltransferase
MAECVVAGDDAGLADLLNVNIPDVWTEFGAPAFQWTLDNLASNPESAPWWSYLPVLKETDTLVGTCGYKGPPDEHGVVEIGYEVAPAYRNRGLAGNMVQLLVQQALDHPDVSAVWAHTLAEENASVRVLRRNGFVFAGEFDDPDDGKVWRWVRER